MALKCRLAEKICLFIYVNIYIKGSMYTLYIVFIHLVLDVIWGF